MTDVTTARSWREVTSSDAGSLVAALGRRSESEAPAFTYLDYSDTRDAVPRTLKWAEAYLRNAVGRLEHLLAEASIP